ncbi:hypothetical protein AJ79_02373 [Helicocarpus griseus UAMH5409]|uniref:Uncharacterized protein n=1 Tax=Helicocarpus griseus UAMH5409 TaxID=1447875 RepID=A0A2B7Y3H1_9EURO|nr:hypothetical protein AJ79_02373 [Helicocarpus griseus UAMH5409]
MCPQWTAEEKAKGKEISKRRKDAQKASGSSEFGSAEYFESTQEETRAIDDYNNLRWQVNQRLPADSKEFTMARQMYLERRRQMERKQPGLKRKQKDSAP